MKINCAKNGACTNNRYRFSCEGDTAAAAMVLQLLLGTSSRNFQIPHDANGARTFRNFLHDAKLEGTCSIFPTMPNLRHRTFKTSNVEALGETMRVWCKAQTLPNVAWGVRAFKTMRVGRCKAAEMSLTMPDFRHGVFGSS
jgi:hypothetical protein